MTCPVSGGRWITEQTYRETYLVPDYDPETGEQIGEHEEVVEYTLPVELQEGIKMFRYLGTDFYPRLIDDETFQKAQEIRLQTATKLGRVRPAKVRTVKAVNLNFTVGTIEKRFQDPYLQAQYAYEQIQEKIL